MIFGVSHEVMVWRRLIMITYNNMFFFDMSYDGRSPGSFHLTLITAITYTGRGVIFI